MPMGQSRTSLGDSCIPYSWIMFFSLVWLHPLQLDYVLCVYICICLICLICKCEDIFLLVTLELLLAFLAARS